MNATFLKSIVNIEDLPKSDRPQIALVGRSNVGKSSLINHLVNQKNLARVSASPGRTRTINIFDVDKRFFLIDLPGYGFAKASKEKRIAFENLLNDYMTRAEHLKFVLVIVDARLGLSDIDREMLTFLETTSVPFAVIANKIDKLKKSEILALQREVAKDEHGIKLILHSNVTDSGQGEIRQAIEQAIKAAAKK
ncbi:MAG: ribosome biogenesis GTP-binding protein YihA/YsxC [Patescibacteria group bacterium]|nr:ribosome biogenesis GTP-binding protein YihA/YsxC [Patescibacteria group bacterium]